MQALGNSLIVGVASTLAATVLGTLAALGLSRRRFPWRALAMGVILAPMISFSYRVIGTVFQI